MPRREAESEDDSVDEAVAPQSVLLRINHGGRGRVRSQMLGEINRQMQELTFNEQEDEPTDLLQAIIDELRRQLLMNETDSNAILQGELLLRAAEDRNRRKNTQLSKYERILEKHQEIIANYEGIIAHNNVIVEQNERIIAQLMNDKSKSEREISELKNRCKESDEKLAEAMKKLRNYENGGIVEHIKQILRIVTGRKISEPSSTPAHDAPT